MIASNKYESYSGSELDKITKKFKIMMKAVERSDSRITEHMTNPKPELSSVEHVATTYYIEPFIMAEAKRLENISMPIHEIVNKYEEWVGAYIKLAERNMHNLGNKKVLNMILDIRKLISTIGKF